MERLNKSTRFASKTKAIVEAHVGVEANVLIRFDGCDFKITTYGTPSQIVNNAKFRLAKWLTKNYANKYRTTALALSAMNEPKAITVTIDPKDFSTIRGIVLP